MFSTNFLVFPIKFEGIIENDIIIPIKTIKANITNKAIQKYGLANRANFFVPDAKAWTDEYKSMVRTYSRNPFEQDLVFIGVNGVEVAPGAHVAIPSGIKTIIPTGLAMMMVNKSGVATKLKLDHSACLIDSEYRDELIFCFFNNNQERIVIEPGMKLTQGLIVPVYNVQMQEVLNCVYDDLGSQTNRGGGFGSSGCC